MGLIRRTTTVALTAALLAPGVALAQDANDPDLYRPAPRPKKDQVRKTIKKVAPKVTITPQQLQQGVVIPAPVLPAATDARATGARASSASRKPARSKRRDDAPAVSPVGDATTDRSAAPAIAPFDATPADDGGALQRAGTAGAGGGIVGLLLALGLPAAAFAATGLGRRRRA